MDCLGAYFETRTPHTNRFGNFRKTFILFIENQIDAIQKALTVVHVGLPIWHVAQRHQLPKTVPSSV